MTQGDSEGTQRLIAWTVVIGVHVGLFCLLAGAPGWRRVESESESVRLRLVFLDPATAPAPPVIPDATTEPRSRPLARIIARMPLRADAPVVLPAPAIPAMPAAVPAPIDWQQQAREQARQLAPSDASTFRTDPLRSRRAQLPGGERGGRFAMRGAVTPADVAGFIGGLFGSYPPPCPRVRENIAGLLTSTSDHDRELLQEELRQQREYCSP